MVSHQGTHAAPASRRNTALRPVWTPSPGWNGTAPSPATAHLGQELIQVVTQLGPSCRSGSIKPWGNTTPLCAAIDHGSPNCTVTVCCSPAHGSSHTHLIHNRPHQGPTLRTQAMKRAGDRTRTGDVQLGKQPVWTPSPGWNGTAPSPATAHLGQELIQVVTQLGPSCRSGSIKPWGNTTPLCAAIDHGSPNCTVTVCCSPAHGSSHTHLIHNRPHQGPTLRTQAMKRAGDRTRTGDVQLGKQPVWTPSPGWNGTAPSPATAHLGQELIQVVTQLGPSCRSGSIKPWGNTTPLCAAIDHGSPNCTVTVCCSPAHGSSHTHLIHNRPHQGPTLRTQAMKRAGDRTRTGDVQLGKLTFYH